MKKWILAITAYTFYAIFVITVALPKLHSEPRTASTSEETPNQVSNTQNAVPTPDGLYLSANDVRRQYNLPQYVNEGALEEIANERCADMVANDYYSHVNPKTGVESPDYIINRIREIGGWDGSLVVGENLNSGYSGSSKEFVDNWLTSESHKAALLDPQFTHAGFATCRQNSGKIIVVHVMANYR